jgi:hypothetical protein
MNIDLLLSRICPRIALKDTFLQTDMFFRIIFAIIESRNFYNER